MATQTTNYNLTKPDLTDPVDVRVLNTNSDIIDTALAGKASLINGKVPASELPSYVDDVIEGYYYNGAFYEDDQHTTAITGETGKIYVDLSTDSTYRWSGSAFVIVSSPNIPVTDVQNAQGDSLVTSTVAAIPYCQIYKDMYTTNYTATEIWTMYGQGVVMMFHGAVVTEVIYEGANHIRLSVGRPGYDSNYGYYVNFYAYDVSNYTLTGPFNAGRTLDPNTVTQIRNILSTGVVSDVQDSNGNSLVTNGIATIPASSGAVNDVQVNGTSVVNAGVASVTVPTAGDITSSTSQGYAVAKDVCLAIGDVESALAALIGGES